MNVASLENRRINIFHFTTSFFEKASDFECYMGETLPELLTVEHTCLRKPDVIVFAYQGDQRLWGYAEIEGWEVPTEDWAAEGEEWGGARFGRLYKVKPCSLKEFKKHVPYVILNYRLGFDTRRIVYAPGISVEIFNMLLIEAEGETSLCTPPSQRLHQ